MTEYEKGWSSAFEHMADLAMKGEFDAKELDDIVICATAAQLILMAIKSNLNIVPKAFGAKTGDDIKIQATITLDCPASMIIEVAKAANLIPPALTLD